MSYTAPVEIAQYMRRLLKSEFLRKVESIQDLSTLTLVDLNELTRGAMDFLTLRAAKGLGGRDCVIMATMKNFLSIKEKGFKPLT